MHITPTLLRAAVLHCTASNAALYAPLLSEASARFHINTAQRLVHFCTQVGHESGSLSTTTEIWGPTDSQRRYEGRKDLGNTQAGDGPRFRGRGLIQTTGRSNYAEARDQLRAAGYADVPDFEVQPERLAEPAWAARSACMYWHKHGCNALADDDNVIGIGRLINRGSATTDRPANGEADRLQRWEWARAALASYSAPLNTSPAAPEQPPAPDQAPAAPTPPPTKEAPMVPVVAALVPGLLSSLASSLIQAFAPLAKEKVEKEIARHTDRPEVADQVATAVIGAAMKATGHDDPIAAAAAAKADAAVMQAVQDSALDTLDRLAPMLDKMAAWERDAFADSEASRAAAAERARNDPNDQDAYLTRSIVRLVLGLVAACALLIPVLAYLKAESAVTALVTLVTTGAGIIFGKFGTRYDHRYGSSRGSGAKDVVISELSQRNRTPAP